MDNLTKRMFFVVCIGLVLCSLTPAEVFAWSFSVAQQNPAPEFTMGSASPVTYRVCNNSGNGSTETLRGVRFYLANNNYTTFATTGYAPPTGWSCTRPANNYIQCTAAASADYIFGGSACSQFKNFTFNINSVASVWDRTDLLSDVRARFVGATNYRTPPTALTPNSWTWKAFLVTLTASPSTVGPSCPIVLNMVVKNMSSANANPIAPVPTLPTMVTTGTVTSGSVVNNNGPLNSPLNLNSTITGTMVWNYTVTSASVAGTVKFSACASTGGSCATTTGSTKTSKIITSPTVTISGAAACTLNASLAVAPSCLFSGNTATYTMVVTNPSSTTVYSVRPSSFLFGGDATSTLLSGPTPTQYASLASGATRTFTFTATITGSVDDAFSATGSASSNPPPGPAYGSPVVLTTSSRIGDYIVTINPLSTNAQSSNQELTSSVTNTACNNVSQVSISTPVVGGGWPVPSDIYSTVTNSVGIDVDTWTNAAIAGGEQFSADAGNKMPVGEDGTFYMTYPLTPTTAATYTFTVTVTDDAPTPVTKSFLRAVTVNSYLTGTSTGPNATGTGAWHEDVK